ncbi:MAG: hypothetical protein ACERKZ_07770 [Lachnotalea sp.]
MIAKNTQTGKNKEYDLNKISINHIVKLVGLFLKFNSSSYSWYNNWSIYNFSSFYGRVL